MDSDAIRHALARAADDRGFSLAALSRALGRNPAYIQQYVERGTPRRLAERDRARLARLLDIDEQALGGPPPVPVVGVPRIDVAASAGPGGLVGEERALAPALLDRALLAQLGVAAGRASMIRVRGESMAPTLADGDWILVDGEARLTRPGAIHVVRHDGLLLVKRLRRHPAGLSLESDNPAHPPIVAPVAEVTILGRVVWLSRSL